MWRIEFTAKSAKQFSKLDSQTQKAISRYLDKLLLVDDPAAFGKPLVGDFPDSGAFGWANTG